MTEIEMLLSDALRKSGFPLLSVTVRKDRNKYLTHFDVLDMSGKPIDTFSAFGECNIDSEQDIDFLAFRIAKQLQQKFGGK